MNKLSTAAVLIVCMMLVGCGYYFGSPSNEPATVAVSLFENLTREPLLEKELSNYLISELERSPNFTPYEAIADSSMSIEGQVTGYASAAVAYDPDDKIVRYLVTISALTTLREEPSGRVIWKGVSNASEEYPANLDKALQRQSEEQARLVALARLAEEVVQRLSHRF
jgi:hypothetical protein